MDEPPDVATLVDGLVAPSDSARKYAVFKLQSLLSDPAFADAFIEGGGLRPLRRAVLETTGNTQAYALGSLDAVLELDMGWEICDGVVIEKAISLAVTHPLVNIVRNALTLLVLIVSRPASSAKLEQSAVYGFRAIKPALDSHPAFLESLVQRLNASDHTLCANALQLINALMKDAIVSGGENEWPKFIKKLQELGVIGNVGMLMRGDAVRDADSPLALAVLEFQNLTKGLLKKWREVRVNVEVSEHKRGLKAIHLLSKPEPYFPPDGANGEKRGRRHHPEKWRRLGFESESPAWEFDEAGYLGMMDLVDYTRRNQDTFAKTLMEQSVQSIEQRCPVARASLSVTLILYEHFEIQDTVELDSGFVNNAHDRMEIDVDQLFTPQLLQWGRLHTATLNAFLRLWKVAGAEQDDFFKIEEVTRITVDRILGAAGRKTDVTTVEEELRSVSLETARKWQMESVDEVYQDAWGPHLVQVREQLHHESLQFMKEQRIRCLLQGSWFPTSAPATKTDGTWRYVKLSINRRWLHYQNYTSKGETQPPLAELPEKIDLNTVTSVDSDVSTSEPTAIVNGTKNDNRIKGTTSTKITILGSSSSINNKSPIGGTGKDAAADEAVLLELYPQAAHLASEWLDGLLMLLNQQPITKDTTRLIDMLVDWGVRLRMLNLRWEDVDWEALETSVGNGHDAHAATAAFIPEDRRVPSRAGLDEDYWYAMPEV